MIYDTVPTDFAPRFSAAATLVEYHPNDGGPLSVLFLQRHIEKPQGGTWCLPCGKANPGEKPSAAASRELFEETGLRVHAEALSFVARVAVQHAPQYGGYQFWYHLFRYRVSEILEMDEKRQRPITLNLQEHTAIFWCPPWVAWRSINLIPDEAPCLKRVYGIR
ncbi:MAG: NUDIX hydrolase [Candidatus Pacebacteria bacterium]|nr:NUDIX hydrolase [Candidatus Paceibacterota bacterium]